VNIKIVGAQAILVGSIKGDCYLAGLARGDSVGRICDVSAGTTIRLHAPKQETSVASICVMVTKAKCIAQGYLTKIEYGISELDDSLRPSITLLPA
jgi:hypothetical protein